MLRAGGGRHTAACTMRGIFPERGGWAPVERRKEPEEGRQMNTHPGVSRTWVNASAATVLLPESYPSSLSLVHDGHVICHSLHRFLKGNRKTKRGKEKGWKHGSVEEKRQNSPGPATRSLGDSRPAASPPGALACLSVRWTQHHCSHLTETVGRICVKVQHDTEACGCSGKPGDS